MTDLPERDPMLQALFDAARRPLPGDGFTIQLMARAERLRRRELLLRGFVGACVAVLAVPLQDYMLPLTELMMTSLIEVDGGLLSIVIAPINTLGALLSLGFFGLRKARQKLFA